ncbi:hypothetical protein [Aestuariicoccus sp. MJ-SS9]|uniref:hypothetical protein n=1 Tax=Aestuariicoccus sp. MJ-SS9 TaxID=3079855 RepID=UPI002913CEC4|nr:hypothetical protein [Aestuariicoccus sp. MJ-SS9]MDU8913932.1 hypothetical protein [Aestuariicoccus sp. MJ-SS9]
MTLSRLNRYIRHRLAGREHRPPAWAEHDQMFLKAISIVQFFYIYTSVQFYRQASIFSNLQANEADRFSFLWPLAWMDRMPLDLAGDILASLCVIVGLASIFLWRFFLVRLAVAALFLQIAAFSNSAGGINHGYHEWLWITFVFLLLPNASRLSVNLPRATKIRFLYAFGVAPTLILFFYTLSGIYKVLDATLMLIIGELGGFHPWAMAYTLAKRSLETGTDPLWAGLIIDIPILGWPLYLALYYIEFFSILVAFRPELVRVWGLLLIAFHFGTYAFLDITFPQHVLINGILFVMSPFAPSKFHWRRFVLALPIFGWLARSLQATVRLRKH